MHRRILLPSGCSQPTETEAHTAASTAGREAVRFLVISRQIECLATAPGLTRRGAVGFARLRKVPLMACEAARLERLSPETMITEANGTGADGVNGYMLSLLRLLLTASFGCRCSVSESGTL